MSAASNTLYLRRRITNGAALLMACATAAFGLLFLGWILWTLLSKGLPGINMDLFTKMTPPPMQEGGLLNAFFYNDAPGTLSGIGQLVFTNMTGSAARNTLTLTSSGTLAPGAPTGTLELVNTAATLNNGTLAVRVLNESTSSQLKISGLGAAFSLGGASDTLDVIPVDGTPWAGLAVFRIYEGGPLTGTFDTLLWNGEPASGEYSVTYGTTFIDIAVNGSRTTVIVIK